MRGPRQFAVRVILALTALMGVGLLFEAPAAAAIAGQESVAKAHVVARADSHETSFTANIAPHFHQLDQQGADVDDDDAPDLACCEHFSHPLRTELESASAEHHDNDSIRTVWLAIAARAPPSA